MFDKEVYSVLDLTVIFNVSKMTVIRWIEEEGQFPNAEKLDGGKSGDGSTSPWILLQRDVVAFAKRRNKEDADSDSGD